MLDLQYIDAALRDLSENTYFAGAIESIVPGKFLRAPENEIYRDRQIYTRELRKFVYNQAVMNEILQNADLKVKFFRVFGYSGSVDFTMYPNTWLRDLPLLDIGSGTYLGDGAVLGTNQVSPDQRYVTVDGIRIGARCIFDQQCMIGYGTEILDGARISLQCLIGMKVKLGFKVQMKTRAQVGHGSSIGNGAVIGYGAAIGNFSQVFADAKVPDHATIPPFSVVSHEGVYPRRARARNV